MKATVSRKVTEEVDVAFLQIDVPVNYDEEDMPNNFPGRKGDTWSARIDLDAMKIVSGKYEWPVPFELYMKVVDAGSYELLDRNMKRIAAIEQGYVPRCLGEYGDYLAMTIQPDGVVKFFREFDPSDWFPKLKREW